MIYNPNLHHRRSIRLSDYDYSQSGFYFITICTQDRKYLFGQIKNNQMILNFIGQLIKKWWLKFPQIQLDEFIIMPNHIHGIIEIVDNPHVGANHVGANTRVRPHGRQFPK